MRISISVKIMSLVIAGLFITTLIFAMRTSKVFETKLYDRENKAVLDSVIQKLKDVDSTINSARERVEVIAAMMIQKELAAAKFKIPRLSEEELEKDEISINLRKDRNLLCVEVFKVNGANFEPLQRRVKKELLQTYKQEAIYIDYVRRYAALNYNLVAQSKKIEVKNASFPNGPALLSMAIPVLQDEFGNVTHIAVADLTLGILLRSFAVKTEQSYFATDSLGVVLAHEDESLATTRASLVDSPIVQKATKDTDDIPRLYAYVDPSNREEMIAAYGKSSNGIFVFSQIKKSVVLEPSREVKNQAVDMGGIIIAISLLISALFSVSLTAPIEKLASLITQVSKGNFEVKARSQVTSQDEVGDLALAFDHMTEGLKERDKVKTLFSKFHGSTVAENLIASEITVGGKNKEVTVFFSDIRGFTSFSEKHEPEEVVLMLNEYFEIMVGIITKYGGVVDKFIGDAIMAVWGAPKGASDDTKRAVRAALEMRRALLVLNQKRKQKNLPPIKIGMGLHCGRAISGTIGSHERMEYTVIGDTVNMTSRIEASTKAFGSDLLVSEAICQKVGTDFIFELAGHAEVKGKTEPLALYKVRGYLAEDGTEHRIVTEYSDYECEEADKVKVA